MSQAQLWVVLRRSTQEVKESRLDRYKQGSSSSGAMRGPGRGISHSSGRGAWKHNAVCITRPWECPCRFVLEHVKPPPNLVASSTVHHYPSWSLGSLAQLDCFHLRSQGHCNHMRLGLASSGYTAGSDVREASARRAGMWCWLVAGGPSVLSAGAPTPGLLVAWGCLSIAVKF